MFRKTIFPTIFLVSVHFPSSFNNSILLFIYPLLRILSNPPSLLSSEIPPKLSPSRLKKLPNRRKMVDVFLIVVCIVFTLLCFFAAFFMIALFQMREEGMAPCHAWFGRIIATIAFGTAAMNVLVLPLDALNRSSSNTLEIELMCWIFTLLSLILAFVVLPFSIFFYENKDDEEHKCPIFCALLAIVPFVLFAAIFFVVLWFAVGYCEIPVQVLSSTIVEELEDLDKPCLDCSSSDDIWKVSPSVIVYIIAVIGFLGFILMLMQGGCGMITLPFGLIGTFVNRPKPISSEVYAHAIVKINEWSEELLAGGEALQADVRRMGRLHPKVRKRYSLFQQQVDALEETYGLVEVSYKLRGGNPIWPWISLILGIVCIIFSLIWIIHVVFYYILGMSPILNDFFLIMDKAFPFGSVIFYGLFVYYLFWTVLDGTASVGVNLVIIRLHPMERYNTPMTSIVFNSVIILFASFGCAMFASMNFNLYTRLSSLDMIYGVQMQTLAGLKYVWQYGVYVWFGFMVLGLIWRLIVLKKGDRKIKDIRACFAKHNVKKLKPKKKKDIEQAPGDL